MSIGQNPDLFIQQRFRRASNYFIAAVLFVVLLVIVGWQWDIEFLRSPLSGSVAMNPATAICLVLACLSLRLVAADRTIFRRASLACAVLVMLVVLLRLENFHHGFPFAIDMILFRRKLAESSYGLIRDRMSISSSICLLLLAVSLQLKWEPFLNPAEIGVAVKDGIVTLTGQVESYNKKVGAELAVKKIAGVKAVAEEIHVGVSPAYMRTDTELAAAVANALKWHTAVTEDKIRILVAKGVVTLSGEVDWNFQRQAAVDAVRNLNGVTRVNNFITIKAAVTSTDVRQKIISALQRNATIDADKIVVETIGNKVILRGAVRSLAERDDAELAAWSAPGVASVENKLSVAVPEYSF